MSPSEGQPRFGGPSELRVVFHALDQAFVRPGGGEVQLMETRRHLQAMGVQVDLFNPWEPRLSQYAIVHSFALAAHSIWRSAKACGCVLAVSTICWPGPHERIIREVMKRISPGLNRLGLTDWQRRQPPFELVDVFFPNSQAEADALCRALNLPVARMWVVPNGVDERFAHATPDAFVERYGLRGFVLCVGLFDPRKNQLALVRALRGCGRDVVFIGPARVGCEGYLRQCVEEADGRFHFLGAMDHESELLASAYAAAGVFALPSVVETPGLAALEAGLAGAPVVITTGGSTREYFADHAVYVDPRSPGQIREAVEHVLAKPPDPTALREHILGHFLWRHCAEATVEGYRRAVDGRL
jgi:glycosyltransferase involved in cell wall biosynthesis